MSILNKVYSLHDALELQWYKWINTKNKTVDIIEKVKNQVFFLKQAKNYGEFKLFKSKLQENFGYEVTKEMVGKCFRMKPKSDECKKNLKIHRQVGVCWFEEIFG